MGGAAAVLGAMLAVHRLGIKRNVVGVATVAENSIVRAPDVLPASLPTGARLPPTTAARARPPQDGLSYKPHAVLRSHKGFTVEIGNTDAEGRLALADALSYGQQRHKPHTVRHARARVATRPRQQRSASPSARSLAPPQPPSRRLAPATSLYPVAGDLTRHTPTPTPTPTLTRAAGD